MVAAPDELAARVVLLDVRKIKSNLNDMNTTLEAVRAKVIGAVPEIVEPVLGCRLKEGLTLLLLEFRGPIMADYAVRVQDDKGWCRTMIVYTENLERWKNEQIIGRPITLADVLRAIYPHDYGIDSAGGFLRYAHAERWVADGPTWNLALPLDEQEPEVIEFLHKILCV